jgi:hypothetical protein
VKKEHIQVYIYTHTRVPPLAEADIIDEIAPVVLIADGFFPFAVDCGLALPAARPPASKN